MMQLQREEIAKLTKKVSTGKKKSARVTRLHALSIAAEDAIEREMTAAAELLGEYHEATWPLRLNSELARLSR